MAGKWCMGTADVPNDHALASAYCDGRWYASVAGDLAENPHPAGSPANAAWAAGWTSWGADPGPGGPRRDCCELPYGGGFVAP